MTFSRSVLRLRDPIAALADELLREGKLKGIVLPVADWRRRARNRLKAIRRAGLAMPPVLSRL